MQRFYRPTLTVDFPIPKANKACPHFLPTQKAKPDTKQINEKMMKSTKKNK